METYIYYIHHLIKHIYVCKLIKLKGKYELKRSQQSYRKFQVQISASWSISLGQWTYKTKMDGQTKLFCVVAQLLYTFRVNLYVFLLAFLRMIFIKLYLTSYKVLFFILAIELAYYYCANYWNYYPCFFNNNNPRQKFKHRSFFAFFKAQKKL